MKANGASASPPSQSPSSSLSPAPPAHALPVVILGTDAVMAAAPATPVQLAHACLRAGFASVIPSNWGDELIASGILRRLTQRGSAPAIQCSCPIVAHRLLAVSGDLRHVMVPLVSPPVAVARYVRALSQPAITRITFVGACPGAIDDAIDIRMTPAALLELLAERDIVPEEQPTIFEAVLPPDRRRFRSQPGGLPTPEALWNADDARTLVEISGEDIPTEIAQHLLSGKTILIDAAARLGCVCSGASPGISPHEARARVVALDPPRSASPVVDEDAPIELDLPVPAASRTPVDVMAVVEASGQLARMAPVSPPAVEQATPHRSFPERVVRTNASMSPTRPVLGGVPIARDTDGRTLPRAYVARRRPSPRSNPIVPATPHHHPPMSAAGPVADASPMRADRAIVQPALDAPLATPPTAGGERNVPLTATAEPARPVIALATPPPAAAEPQPVPSDPTLDTLPPPRSSRPVQRDSTAARLRADEARDKSRRRTMLIVLFFVAISASTAAGLVIGRWWEARSHPTASP